MIKVGIIGCGKIAQVRHIPEYLSNPNVKLQGFYDLKHGRAQELADRYGGIAFNTMEELLDDREIDAVSVCVANIAHASDTIAALKAGKHVLCEKPMATTLDDCVAMVQASKDSGRKLMIDQNQRLAKAHKKARELVRNGFIGRVITFRTTFGHSGPETWSIDPGKDTWFFDRSRSGMGVMADLGVHKTDLIQYILGQKVIATTAKLSTLDKRDANDRLIGVDDNAMCIYEMDGGTIGTMTSSWTYYGEEDNSTILYGEKGILRIYDRPDHAIVAMMRNGERIFFDLDQIQTNDNQTSTGIIDSFVDCIINDTKPEIDGEDVLNAMKAVFGSILSSEQGRRIEIKDVR